MLTLLDEECETQRSKLVSRAKDNLEIVRGPGQWKMKRNPYFLYNVIEKNIEAKVSKLAETKPTIRVMPDRPGVEESCNVIQTCVEAIWDNRHMESRIERLGYFGAIMGAGFAGTPFNRELNNGDGDIDFVARDPRSVGFDTAIVDSTDIDGGEFVEIQDVMPLDIIQNTFPGRGGLVTRDDRLSVFEEPGKTPLGAIKTAIQRWTGGVQGATKGSAIPRCMVKEFWIKDRRSSCDNAGQFPIIEGLTSYALDGKPFPGGRRILTSMGDGGMIILKDEYNPYWDGAPPTDMLSWRVDLESAWGPDEVQRMKRVQEAINRIGDAYTKNMILNSVERMVVDKGALDKDELDKLSNEAAQIIYKNPGREFKHDVPPPLPPETLPFINRLIELSEVICGTADSALQKRVPSIVTGPAVEGLQLAVETAQRAVARRLEDFLQRVGQKLISRIFQYYTTDRLLHYVGPTQEWTQFMFERSKILVSKDHKTGITKLRNPEDIRKAYMDFKFKVEPGSSLAVARAQRSMMKFQFAQQGWLPPWEAMKELGIDNAQEKYELAQKEIQAGRMQAPTPSKQGGQISKAIGM